MQGQLRTRRPSGRPAKKKAAGSLRGGLSGVHGGTRRRVAGGAKRPQGRAHAGAMQGAVGPSVTRQPLSTTWLPFFATAFCRQFRILPVNDNPRTASRDPDQLCRADRPAQAGDGVVVSRRIDLPEANDLRERLLVCPGAAGSLRPSPERYLGADTPERRYRNRKWHRSRPMPIPVSRSAGHSSGQDSRARFADGRRR